MSRKTQVLTLLATLCTGVAFAATPAAYAQHVFVQTTAGVSVFDTNMKLVGSYTPKGSLLGNDGLVAGTNAQDIPCRLRIPESQGCGAILRQNTGSRNLEPWNSSAPLRSRWLWEERRPTSQNNSLPSEGQ